MYLDISETEKRLLDVQKIIASQSVSHGDFCSRTGMYMETLFQDAKANERHLGEPYLAVRSRMAASLYYDGLGRLSDISNSRDRSCGSVLDTKPSLTSPPSAPLSSIHSSPFLSSEDLSTPRTCQIPAPESLNGKQMEDFWTDDQIVDEMFIPEVAKASMDWFAESFLNGESSITHTDLSKYVAPGLLTVQ